MFLSERLQASFVNSHQLNMNLLNAIFDLYSMNASLPRAGLCAAYEVKNTIAPPELKKPEKIQRSHKQLSI